MKNIIISGTPGTGKTTVSNHLGNLISAQVISLNELIIDKKYIVEYDDKRDTYVIDEAILLKNLEAIINGYRKTSNEYLIIEGHFSDIIPEDLIDYVIILRCHPDELYNRLKKRGYKKIKIMENIQSEILGNCVNYFIEKKLDLPLYEIDTTKSEIKEIVKVIIDIINDNLDMSIFRVGKIDWLENLSNTNRLDEFFM
jgi:adenylate kinase